MGGNENTLASLDLGHDLFVPGGHEAINSVGKAFCQGNFLRLQVGIPAVVSCDVTETSSPGQ